MLENTLLSYSESEINRDGKLRAEQRHKARNAIADMVHTPENRKNREYTDLRDLNNELNLEHSKKELARATVGLYEDYKKSLTILQKSDASAQFLGVAYDQESQVLTKRFSRVAATHQEQYSPSVKDFYVDVSRSSVMEVTIGPASPTDNDDPGVLSVKVTQKDRMSQKEGDKDPRQEHDWQQFNLNVDPADMSVTSGDNDVFRGELRTSEYDYVTDLVYESFPDTRP